MARTWRLLLLNMIDIEFTDRQSTLSVNAQRLQQAARTVLQDHGPDTVRLSIAVVDNATIHELNRRFLEHDYPTDVLSFTLEQQQDQLEGEVVVSADMAVKQAGEYGVPPEDELLLYVIHGVLHLVGFDDKSPELSEQMRSAEQRYLEQFGSA